MDVCDQLRYQASRVSGRPSSHKLFTSNVLYMFTRPEGKPLRREYLVERLNTDTDLASC